MTIGITGSNGTIGRRLKDLLAASGVPFASFDGDIRNFDVVRSWASETEPSAIIHLAAIVDVGKAADDPVQAYDVNTIGTANLLQALESLDSKCWFFYASTSHVYKPIGRPINEADPIRPATPYALSKYLGERIAQNFALQNKIDLCIGRIFSIYDPEQQGSFLYPAYRLKFQAAGAEDVLVVKNGRSVRDFSLANDIALNILNLMRLRYSGVINIASGEGRQVVEHLTRWFGENVKLVSEDDGEITHVVADISRLREIVDVELT